MKILVVSVVTGSAQARRPRENPPIRATFGSSFRAATRLAPVRRIRRRRPRFSRCTLPTQPPRTFPAKSRLSYRFAPSGCTNAGACRLSRALAGRRDDAASGEGYPFPRRPPTLAIPLCRSLHGTRYRTTLFDNLRGTWKSRMYWGYTKHSDLGNPDFGMRGELSGEPGGL